MEPKHARMLDGGDGAAILAELGVVPVPPVGWADHQPLPPPPPAEEKKKPERRR